MQNFTGTWKWTGGFCGRGAVVFSHEKMNFESGCNQTKYYRILRENIRKVPERSIITSKVVKTISQSFSIVPQIVRQAASPKKMSIHHWINLVSENFRFPNDIRFWGSLDIPTFQES